MKRFIAIIALVAMALSGCTEDTYTLDELAESVVTFSASSSALSVQSRGVATTEEFEEGDSFGIFSADEDESFSNIEYAYSSSEDGTLEAAGKAIVTDDDKLTFYAYSPFQSDASLDAITVDVSDQSADDIDLLVSAVTSMSDRSVAFTLSHALTLVNISLEASVTESDLSGLKLYLEYPESASFDLTKGSFSGVSDYTQHLLSPETDGSYQVILIPGNYTSARLYFYLDGSLKYYKDLGQSLVSGYIYNCTAKVGYDNCEFEVKSEIAWNKVESLTFSDVDILYNSTDALYQIYTAKGLKAFADLVNGTSNTEAVCAGGSSYFDFSSANLSINALLMNDIDLSSICSEESGSSWTPIGGTSYSVAYQGTFDGNGYEISGLYIYNTSRYVIGLFGLIYGATIKNLGVRGSVEGTNTNGCVGGISGSNYQSNTTNIDNCYFIGSVRGEKYVGGIIGDISVYNSTFNITNCYCEGTVTATTNSNLAYAGGIVGDISGSTSSNVTIANCYFDGTVTYSDTTPSSEYFGGLVGRVSAYNSSNGTTCTVNLLNSYVKASVSGYKSVGGLVGYSYSNTVIQNCYVAASVTATGGNIGSVIGKLDNSTSSSATDFAETVIKDCYYNSTLSSIDPIGEFSVVTTTEAEYEAECTAMSTELMQSTYFGITLNSNIASITSTSSISGWGQVDGAYPSFTTTSISSGAYEIYTAADLATFRDLVNSGDEDINAILMDDIDLEGSATNLWTPIGTDDSSSAGYGGTFDGNGKTITGLYVKNDSQSGLGLFGYCYYGTLKDLTVGGYVESGATSVYEHFAIVCGGAHYSTFTNCSTVEGSVVKGEYNAVAGIVGYIYNCTISDCTNRADVTGDDYVGGIVGYVSPVYSSTITGCVNWGNMTGTQFLGGIAGFLNVGASYMTVAHTLSNSVNFGDINASSNFAGGIVGKMYGRTEDNTIYYRDKVINCVNFGDVTADDTSDSSVGGLVGANQGGEIYNSYNMGSVTGSVNVGGLVGIHEDYVSINATKAIIENCYSSGTVSDGSSKVGGAIGYNDISTITNCYFNSSLYSGDGVGSDEGTTTNCKGIVTDQMTNGVTLLYNLNGGMPSGQSCETWVQGSDRYPTFEFVEALK